jgi:purine-binding chemotaxis protein CheW
MLNIITDEEHLILKKRADKLARLPEDTTVTGDLEILKFSLVNEIYAFETKYIKEVLELKELVSLPLTPAFVKGIISLRGEIISVLDIKSFFNLQFQGITDLNKVIILKLKEMEFGILADKILDVDKIHSNNLHKTLLGPGSILDDYLLGVTSDRVTVFDGYKFLTDENIIVSDEY